MVHWKRSKESISGKRDDVRRPTNENMAFSGQYMSFLEKCLTLANSMRVTDEVEERKLLGCHLSKA